MNFSILVGSRACNADCPFCISHQTGLPLGMPPIDWDKFKKAYALAYDCEEVMLTGKGEPTLYPSQVEGYLEQITDDHITALQTNGISLTFDMLEQFKDAGLDIIALSAVSIDTNINRSVYSQDYKDLQYMIEMNRACGLETRLCIMVIDQTEPIEELISFCREHQVMQLTVRSLADIKTDERASKFIEKHGVMIPNHIVPDLGGVLMQETFYGAKIYDVDGQNVCVSNCMTHDTKQRRNIIFDGQRIYTNWQYPEGSRIL